MVLKLIELAEADLPAYVKITASAFEGGFAAQAMLPGGITSGYVDFSLEQEKASFHKHNQWRLAVVDTATGEIICIALWKLEDENSSKASEEKHDWFPHSNIEAKEAFFGMNRQARLAVMGQKKAYWHLSLLATKPGHERRGAGGIALRWGIDRADKDKLETFLVASAVGRPLYEKFGFNTVREQPLDLSKFGVNFLYTSTSMVRPPKALN